MKTILRERHSSVLQKLWLVSLTSYYLAIDPTVLLLGSDGLELAVARSLSPVMIVLGER